MIANSEHKKKYDFYISVTSNNVNDNVSVEWRLADMYEQCINNRATEVFVTGVMYYLPASRMKVS